MSAKLSLVEGEKTELEAKYEAEVKGRRELEGKKEDVEMFLNSSRTVTVIICTGLSFCLTIDCLMPM